MAKRKMIKTLFSTASVCLAVYVLVVAGYLFGADSMTLLAGGLLVLFVVLEFPRIARGQIAAGAVLIGIGLGAAAFGGDPAGAVASGLRRTQSFFLLFAAVAWLQVPVNSSRAMRAAQEWAIHQPPGRRFAVLGLAAHLLGSVLNLAGISLLSGVVRDRTDPLLRRRLTQAIMQGFTAASCWTPFFVAMTVVLSVIPGLRWSDLAPLGLCAAFGLAVLGWVMDRITSRVGRPLPEAAPEPDAAAPFDWRMPAIPASLFVTVILLVEGLHLQIPIALGLMAPVYAAAWIVLQTHGLVAPRVALADLARRVFGALPGLRSETFLFLGANLMGAGVAAALPPETMKAAVEALHLSPDANIVLMMAAILICGAAGLHPVIIFVLVGEVLPPEVLGVTPVIMGAALLVMWGLGAVVSPLSATTLYLGRAAETAPWRIAWLWNGPYAIAGTGLAALLIVVARHLGIH